VRYGTLSAVRIKEGVKYDLSLLKVGMIDVGVMFGLNKNRVT
jgi:hypothetical protein